MKKQRKNQRTKKRKKETLVLKKIDLHFLSDRSRTRSKSNSDRTSTSVCPYFSFSGLLVGVWYFDTAHLAFHSTPLVCSLRPCDRSQNQINQIELRLRLRSGDFQSDRTSIWRFSVRSNFDLVIFSQIELRSGGFWQDRTSIWPLSD